MSKISSSALSTTSKQQQFSQRIAPAIIPLDYDYSIMSPSALSHQRIPSTSGDSYLTHLAPFTIGSVNDSIDLETDSNPYSSLFGDPVAPPPPLDFIGFELDSPALYRANNSLVISSEDEALGRTDTQPLIYKHQLEEGLNSEMPSSSTLSRRLSSPSNFDLLPPPLPCLQPPDIRILPNSSRGSGSSDAKDSPNFELLTPQDILRKPAMYKISETGDTTDLIETITISDANGTIKRSEATRRVSNFTEDFKLHVGTLSFSSPNETLLQPITTSFFDRQVSNESYANSDWFHSATSEFPEFSKIPKLRPSSKNVISIKRDEMPMQDSPVASMIHDSNSSSSSEERQLHFRQTIQPPNVPEPESERPLPPAPALSCDLKQEQELLYSTDAFFSCYNSNTSNSSRTLEPFFHPVPLTDPPPNGETKHIKRKMSPVILKNFVATGSENRVEDPRLHKKTSFTIISEKSLQSSRLHSPISHLQQHFLLSSMQHKIRDHTSTTSRESIISTVSKPPVAKPRYHLQRKSPTLTQFKLPHLSTQDFDNSHRLSVQFDMNGRCCSSKLPQKSIIQRRESLTSSENKVALLPTKTQAPMTQQSHRQMKLPETTTTGTMFSGDVKDESDDALSLITNPFRTTIPQRYRSQLNKSLEPTVIPPLKHNPNPTRKQRGLLGVINTTDTLSCIPLHSNCTSLDDLPLASERRKLTSTQSAHQTRRRSSSTSPERRSSIITASDRRSSNLSSVTTSDFSFRRLSLTIPQSFQIIKRQKTLPFVVTLSSRQSVDAPSPGSMFLVNGHTSNKIAKPSRLSPIMGTPNKENSSQLHNTASLTALVGKASLSDISSHRNSMSKIPVRSEPNLRPQSCIRSQPNSRRFSRSSSPFQEYHAQVLAAEIQSSHPTLQPTSHHNSQAPSRSTSRASTRLVSGPHSSNSRPNSRIEQVHGVESPRSNSRQSMRGILSLRKTPRAGSVSPPRPRGQSGSIRTNRRKSISLSPQDMRKIGHSLSITVSKNDGKNSKQVETSAIERTHSRSRIPLHHQSDRMHNATTKSLGSKLKTGIIKANSTSNRRLSKRTLLVSRFQPVKTNKLPHSVAKRSHTDINIKSSSSYKKFPPVGLKQQKNNLQKINDIKHIKRVVLNSQKRPVTTFNISGTNKKSQPKSVLGVKKVVKAKATETSLLIKQSPGKSGIKNDTKMLTELSQASQLEVPFKQRSDSTKPIPNPPVSEKAAIAVALTKNATEGGDGFISAEAAAAAHKVLTPTYSNLSSTAKTAPIKYQHSNMSLLRMSSKISLMSKKRGLTTQPLLEATESTEKADDLSREMTQNINLSNIEHTIDEETLQAEVFLEKSQKASENTTIETHKTTNEYLTDLISLEQDMGKVSDRAISPTSSMSTVVENKSSKLSRNNTADGAVGISATAGTESTLQKSPVLHTQPIEAAVSVLHADGTSTTSNTPQSRDAVTERVSVSARAITVLPEVGCESANFQNYKFGIHDNTGELTAAESYVAEAEVLGDENGVGDFKTEIKRRSPDGQGGSATGSRGRTGSQKVPEQQQEINLHRSICSCCVRFCMLCRRCRCFQSKTKINDESEKPVLSINSKTSTTNLEVIDETHKMKESNCWRKLNFCKHYKSNKKENEVSHEEELDIHQQKHLEAIRKKHKSNSAAKERSRKQNKCGLCLSKIFCCRSVNKVNTTSGIRMEVKKCCFWIPCRRKDSGRNSTMGSVVDPSATGSTATLQDPKQGHINETDASVMEEGNEVTRREVRRRSFWHRMICCKLNPDPRTNENRRASIKAPPLLIEDTRRKLHVDLVEYNSKMKGAIPVLPLYLAWFCAICNIIFPGLGTFISGFFCVCFGIPRFSQYDSAKARLGSLVINVIVAVAQLFCVLFCFVGWGWSIWWGAIMLKCAKKLNKIKKVERLEMEEERRQAETASTAVRLPHIEPVLTKT